MAAIERWIEGRHECTVFSFGVAAARIGSEVGQATIALANMMNSPHDMDLDLSRQVSAALLSRQRSVQGRPPKDRCQSVACILHNQSEDIRHEAARGPCPCPCQLEGQLHGDGGLFSDASTLLSPSHPHRSLPTAAHSAVGKQPATVHLYGATPTPLGHGKYASRSRPG